MLDLDRQTVTRARRIGPDGTVSRLVVGAALLVSLVLGGVTWTGAILGLVAIPASVSIALSLRGLSAPPLWLYGPEGHLINCAIGAAPFIELPAPALAFYGSSMIIAGARGYAGCELLALANAITRRDDEIACPTFAPIDALEAFYNGLRYPHDGRAGLAPKTVYEIHLVIRGALGEAVRRGLEVW